MGRSRKPTAKLKLHGTFRSDRHGERATEPQPAGEPKKPKGLGKLASQHWDAIVPELIKTGVAKSCDTPALESMCLWWQDMQALRHDTEMDGPQRLRLLAAAQRAWNDLAFRFGLTPTDRAKISIEPATKDDLTRKYMR